MTTAYVVTTVVAAAANGYAAFSDFVPPPWMLANMKRLSVPRSSLPFLGVLKAAGAIGLLVGIYVPPVGIAAALGLTAFFLGAIVTALRARWYAHLPLPAVWLLLAVGSLALRVASR